MQITNPNQAIIRCQPQNVGFGFYTDKDVRERSVVEVTSTLAFGPTNNALLGGLYDPRMGPIKDSEPPCPTCALRALHCPGHYGHVECAVPVHHPLLLNDILNILRTKCLACHKMRAPPRQLALFRAKLFLLQTHQIDRYHALDNELQVALRDARREGDDTEQSSKKKKNASNTVAIALAMDAALKEYQPTPAALAKWASSSSPSSKRQAPKFNSYERKIRKQLIRDILSHCKSAKNCPHCSAYSPKIRQDSSNKVFQVTLSNKLQRLNNAEGVKITSALVPKSDDDSDDDGGDSNHRAMDVEGQANRDLQDTDEEEKADDDDDDDDDEDDGAVSKDKFMHTGEVKAQLKRCWEIDPFFMNAVFGPGGSFDKNGYEFYFLQAIPVPPNRFRPPMVLNGMSVLHSQTNYLMSILTQNELVRTHFATKGKEPRAYAAWIALQTAVNCFMDSSKDPSATPESERAPGIKQILERKEGLFRKNMMGKRVDYACRSVISPDPYIGTNEIGVPRYFATVLTYPTPVTDLNIKEMRDLVIRGPQQYPGARWVEIHGKRVDLGRMRNVNKREAIAAQLLTHLKKGGQPAIVGRQLRDGDYVLMNRQPTLHKPGIMAHRVRVLHNPTQKTIRMHYANCNTYNADFDGDEMNCHFPQSDLARAEAQYIAKTDLQYIVPTDGSPLRGLIQDHVIGGVKMTKKDTFLPRWEYQQLLFICLASLPGLEVIRHDADIELLPPAVIKPRELWTGKQVITTLLHHLQKGSERDSPRMSNFPGISTERKSKTPAAAFGAKQEEHLVLIKDGELLRGVLDKSAFGATDFSLVHAVYEAYGAEKAGVFLNALSRLFTGYIQYFAGHSCRTEDLILTEAAEKERKKLVQRAYNVGARAAKAWADAEGGKMPVEPVADQPGADQPLKPFEKAAASAKIGELLSGNEGKDNFAALDGFMQGQLNPLASDIVKKTLPSGLVVPFPFNTFGIMTTTGAKGSIVNQSQVICALGQQALEGRRVPRLSSGRTLPSFAPFDPNPRADGFVMDRFLTGVRPQEYYFHCMAGREGLVDTAVKTSRSGYLQRCLMKHLEELKICYDFTVRNSENAVVQFRYGEDSLDPTKAAFLDCTDRSFTFLAENYHSLKRHNTPLPSATIDLAAADAARNEEVMNGVNLIRPGARVVALKLREGKEWKRGRLCTGWFPAVVTKTHGSRYVDLKYLNDGTIAKKVPMEVDFGIRKGDKSQVLSTKTTLVKPSSFDPIASSFEREHTLGVSGACISEKVAGSAYKILQSEKMKKAMEGANVTSSQVGELISAKYSSSLCAPGEAVGSIAAQSIGEPSTQMTLNTFHLAGSGANVTLGIPRLREIIMTASRELKTPTMSVPLLDNVSEKDALRLTREFTKLTLSELVSGDRGVTVTERLEKNDGSWCRSYYVKIKFHPAERIREAFGFSLHDIAQVVSKNFVPLLSNLMKNELKKVTTDGDIKSTEVIGGGAANYVKEIKDDGDNDADEQSNVRKRAATADHLNDEDDDDDDAGDDAPGEEDGAEASRYRRRAQSISYEDDDDEEKDQNEDGGESDSGSANGSSNQPPTQTEDDDDEPAPWLAEKKGSVRVQEKSNTITLPPLRVDPATRPLLMVGLVETAAGSTVIRAKKKINQGFVNEENGRGRCLQTAGINFEEIWKLDEVDHCRLMTNDIWAMRCAYGVEAARMSIVDQIRSVFGVYGITVDPRHLSLIADYMTFEGGYKAMNRIGMEETSSPLLQMSFETTVHFLRQAVLAGGADDLNSPSANLVVGKPIRHGTGSFSVLAA